MKDNRYLLITNDAQKTVGSISLGSKIEASMKEGNIFELHPSIIIGPEGPMLVGVHVIPKQVNQKHE